MVLEVAGVVETEVVGRRGATDVVAMETGRGVSFVAFAMKACRSRVVST